MTGTHLTLAAIGCSGPVSEIFVHGFLKKGIKVRILARNPGTVRAIYPNADVVEGSMLNPDDVARTMDGADAAFLATPMGLRNDPAMEVKAARAAIAGAKASQLKHLIYTSVLGADKLRGVGILDGKYEVEKMLASSGVPWTALRCGSYMEDVFDVRKELLDKGKFLFPINKSRRFTYTSQEDVPRFVAEELLAKERVLNGPFNFVTPGTQAITDVERLLSSASGFPIKAASKFPVYYLFMSMQPYYYLSGHKFSSILPLIRYFDQHGYVDSGRTVKDLFPDFRMTTLEEHFLKLWPK